MMAARIPDSSHRAVYNTGNFTIYKTMHPGKGIVPVTSAPDGLGDEIGLRAAVSLMCTCGSPGVLGVLAESRAEVLRLP